MPAGLSSPSAQRVAKYLTAHPDSTITDIAKDLGLGRSTVTKALVAMETAGQVTRRRGVRTGNRVEPDLWRTSVTDPARATAPNPQDEDIDTGNSTATAPDEPDAADPPPIAATVVPAPTATVPGTKQRLRPGELREAVLAYFTEHTDIEVTAGEIARVLGRSAGAVHNVLQKAITDGSVALTCTSPRRYKAIPSS